MVGPGEGDLCANQAGLHEAGFMETVYLMVTDGNAWVWLFWLTWQVP